MDKEGVLAFLKSRELCVLATADASGKTQAATMAYVAKDDFSLLFSTDATTRKMANIKVNSKASVVVGCENDNPTVQIDGDITQVVDDSGAAKERDYMLQVHPEWKDYVADGTILRFVPSWTKYSNHATNPPEVLEF
ncbi:pyridoxamine 5'-phosphate oxidase family protein [Candidatus Parcubacteria bacterium]|nr:pyridoxamine 5'-phosphate oxidase family protein [Patescibacteria group bacterium]MBU4381108.1 pyridoxamine 5'-phosphate oxidase family protein [Patescibacteria group bacterium]MCG2689169.1 pyridoxamine 5'-phosphate oxidase family protein [Candidatus Parcubacteria bacterium]